MKNITQSLLFILLLTGFANAQALVINGPSLPNTNTGWIDNGLSITALQDTSLTSFTYNNQGLADTLRLTDTAGNILETFNMGAGSTTQVIDVSWSLLAGMTYYLIAEQNFGNNGTWNGFSSYPVSNADIRINGWVSDVFAGGSNIASGTQYWFHFTDITTGDNVGAVPVPAPLALIGLGLAAIGWARRKA